jgi:hypothetical protein
LCGFEQSPPLIIALLVSALAALAVPFVQMAAGTGLIFLFVREPSR